VGLAQPEVRDQESAVQGAVEGDGGKSQKGGIEDQRLDLPGKNVWEKKNGL
jgi:hypothetical protein